MEVAARQLPVRNGTIVHGDIIRHTKPVPPDSEEDAADGVVLAAVAGMPAVLVDALAHLLQGACAVRDAE